MARELDACAGRLRASPDFHSPFAGYPLPSAPQWFAPPEGVRSVQGARNQAVGARGQRGPPGAHPREIDATPLLPLTPRSGCRTLHARAGVRRERRGSRPAQGPAEVPSGPALDRRAVPKSKSLSFGRSPTVPLMALILNWRRCWPRRSRRSWNSRGLTP
jgi:hypothetical protein